jgi:hypothetical protein
VWAEVRARFPSDGEFEQSLALLGVRFETISRPKPRRWPDGYGARVAERRTESAGTSSRTFSWALTPRSRRTPFSRGTVASIAGISASR